MSITEKLQAVKTAYLNRKPIKSYDHYRIQRRSNVTIGMVKSERLRMKNLRRAENGLPPKATYAEI